MLKEILAYSIRASKAILRAAEKQRLYRIRARLQTQRKKLERILKHSVQKTDIEFMIGIYQNTEREIQARLDYYDAEDRIDLMVELASLQEPIEIPDDAANAFESLGRDFEAAMKIPNDRPS